jgi:hypothetical protein
MSVYADDECQESERERVPVGMGVIVRLVAVWMRMSLVKPYPDTHHHARQH